MHEEGDLREFFVQFLFVEMKNRIDVRIVGTTAVNQLVPLCRVASDTRGGIDGGIGIIAPAHVADSHRPFSVGAGRGQRDRVCHLFTRPGVYFLARSIGGQPPDRHIGDADARGDHARREGGVMRKSDHDTRQPSETAGHDDTGNDGNTSSGVWRRSVRWCGQIRGRFGCDGSFLGGAG